MLQSPLNTSKFEMRETQTLWVYSGENIYFKFFETLRESHEKNLKNQSEFYKLFWNQNPMSLTQKKKLKNRPTLVHTSVWTSIWF